MKILLISILCLTSLRLYAYEADFVGWKTGWGGRHVSKLSSNESACNSLLQKLMDTNGVNLSSPLAPWSVYVLLHPQDHSYYYCIFRAANNTSNDVWGDFWSSELLTEYACSQPRSRLVYPIPNYAYAVPECVCETPYFEKEGVCVPRKITINGASSTMALPAKVGPIAQQVKVDISDDENKTFRVNVVIKESKANVSYSISGVTNSAGIFEFVYVPPYMRASNVDLTATCSDCENTAFKSFSVSSTGTEPPEEPKMCHR